MKSSAVNRFVCLLGFLALSILGPGPAHATHETIVVDGVLTDLTGAIGRNSGSSLGGFVVPDVLGDVYTDKCPHFVNGYDVRNFYVFVDFKNPDGTTDTNPTLYAGWDVFGLIGDVDGNGNPTTFNPSGPHGGCALSDQANIGALESYRMFINFCGTISQIVIKDINGDGVAEVQKDGVTIPAEVAFNGSGLELKIANLAGLFPTADLCNIEFIMTANAEQDGLGEDFNDTRIILDVPPSVKLTKTPLTQTICPDRPVAWTLTVRNDGLCPLATVTVRDTMDRGLTFASSTPARASGNDSVSVWTFTNLAPGQSQTIALNARTSLTCAGTPRNRATAIAVHQTPAGCTGGAEEVRSSVIATVSCGGPVCTITSPPGNTAPPATVIIGDRVELCGPAGLTYLWTRPSGATSTTQCIVIASATVADSGTYRLRLTDANGCTSECTHLLDVNPPGQVECRISGPDSLCVDQPLTLCGPREPAGRNFSYRWTLPDLTVITTPDSCLVVTIPSSGFYQLVVRDEATGQEAGPCVHQFKVHKRPPCAISAPEIIHAGDAVQICGQFGNFGYLWTLPNGSHQTGRCVSIAAVSPADTGLYTLVVTDLGTGCASLPCSYRLVLPPGGFECIVEGPDKVVVGTRVEFCGPTGTGFTYLWTRPNGTTAGTTRCIVILSAQTTDQGVYRLRVTNAAGQVALCERKLLVNEVPECKNCPRPADFWEDECSPKYPGDSKFSAAQLEAIAQCVDGLSTFFNWGNGGTPEAGTLIARKSEWRFHDLGQNLGTTWKDPATSDGTWQSGPGILGYGEPYVTTHVSFGPDASNKYPTTYFRKTFNVIGASGFIGLKLNLMYDDGLVVYLNGTEVARLSMPSGTPTFSTFAHNHEATNHVYETVDLDAFTGLLHDGSNLLAVEVHQTEATSSDLIFDAELIAEIDHGLPAKHSVWRYDATGVDLGTTWKDPSYADGSWASGPGVLGYGESYVTTPVPFGSDASHKHPTTYFRQSFNVVGAASIPALTLQLMYDDGVIVYLNGTEVARRSLTSGTVTFNTLASSHEGNNTYEAINLSGFLSLLHDGINVLAVEVHQTDVTSSDLVFDAALEIPDVSTTPMIEIGSVALEPSGNPPVTDQFCAILADNSNDRAEAKRQFATLLANICASTQPPQTGDPVCLNLDTEVDCKHFAATTIRELIAEVDAMLIALEPGPIVEWYEEAIECLSDINNGWSIYTSKDCPDDDDDKKGRYTPVGADVVVSLGPTVTMMFGEVTAGGTTYITSLPVTALPSGVRAVDGQQMNIYSTATLGGYVKASVVYDETLLHGPEANLQLLRFDVATQSWIEITSARDGFLNRVEGSGGPLSSYVLVEPNGTLAADDPVALKFGLQASSPNPTSGRTTIHYTLTRSGPAKLTVHDVQGRQVAILASGQQRAGEHSVAWGGLDSDGRKLPSGIYAIRLLSNEGLRTTKLVIVN